VFAALFVIAGAQAVHDDGVFQLDRNAYTAADGGVKPAAHDWDQVCPAATPAGIGGCLGSPGTTVSSFTTDPDGATILTTGGAKDDLNLSQWLFKDGSVPDKDEIQHAMAARAGGVDGRSGGDPVPVLVAVEDHVRTVGRRGGDGERDPVAEMWAGRRAAGCERLGESDRRRGLPAGGGCSGGRDQQADGGDCDDQEPSAHVAPSVRLRGRLRNLDSTRSSIRRSTL
jgi:hypothetical protein